MQRENPFLAILCLIAGIPVNWSSDKRGLTVLGLLNNELAL